MNTKFFKRLIICILAIGFSVNYTQGQMLRLENSESSLTVFGTSNLHGWKVDAKTQQGAISFNNLQSCEIDHLSLTVLTTSLKGVKPGMAETASETLKSDKYKYILFALTEVKKITEKDSGVFELEALGDLIIAGTKKSVPMRFDVVIDDNKVILEGKVKLKMTDFNLTPPEALMGAIKAKDDIMLKFAARFIESTIL
ncbi:YceI family protein [Seonamhaeicola maritimus]|uniref:YceI family protein n=1 Tax=Seonamhaeicola maritimus TaxID=2591822 RepID=A0A5C7GLC1_9FLAO|nr:YceI family protein [Seonamhaeicola maritimus]TXG39286.1 YceI family protein [Seonamhaeicola maritimus]